MERHVRRMSWRPFKNMSEPLLHLDDGSGWKPYYATRHATPDRQHMSKGMATFCELLSQGWTSEKSADLVEG